MWKIIVDIDRIYLPFEHFFKFNKNQNHKKNTKNHPRVDRNECNLPADPQQIPFDETAAFRLDKIAQKLEKSPENKKLFHQFPQYFLFNHHRHASWHFIFIFHRLFQRFAGGFPRENHKFLHQDDHRREHPVADGLARWFQAERQRGQLYGPAVPFLQQQMDRMALFHLPNLLLSVYFPDIIDGMPVRAFHPNINHLRHPLDLHAAHFMVL